MSLTPTKVVFMGTPQFAVPTLQALVERTDVEVVLVLTQPDRPQGRKRELTPPPVKMIAKDFRIPVLQPEKLRRDEAVIEAIRSVQPDLIVTAAFGQILPREVLDLPRYGCINVHGSLLPLYRGGAPIQRAIMNGEEVTGVTIMYMAEGLDTGDMISRVVVPIGDEDNAGTMFDKLSVAGAQLLIDTLPSLLDGTARAVQQNEDEATYAPNLTREDERLDWTDDAVHIVRQLRGLLPWTSLYTTWRGDAFKLWHLEVGWNSSGTPGTIVEVYQNSIVVACGLGSVVVREVQPAGKSRLPVHQWVQGARVIIGERFGGDPT